MTTPKDKLNQKQLIDLPRAGVIFMKESRLKNGLLIMTWTLSREAANKLKPHDPPT